MGGDGGIGIGDGSGDISGGGHPAGGYGYGGSDADAAAQGFAGPAGTAPAFGGGPGPGGPSSYTGATQIGPLGGGAGGLGTPYPGIGNIGTGIGGTGGVGQRPTGGNTSFYYPTAKEAHDAIYGLPYMANQARILGNMESMPAFRSAVMPEIQGVMKTLGRSGIPSSSMADRVITEAMGSLYNKWMWNVLTGYQNMGVQMPTMMQQWYQPYNTMLSYVGS